MSLQVTTTTWKPVGKFISQLFMNPVLQEPGYDCLDFFYRIDPKRNAIVQEYILPNFSDNRPGRVKAPDDIIADADQVLFMNSERFTVPELLFQPTDIGSCRSRLSAAIFPPSSQHLDELS